MGLTRHMISGGLVGAFLFSSSLAQAKMIRLKLTYDNRVQLRLITLNNASELDFFLDGKTKNISVYYPDNGQMKFIGDRKAGHGYYFGPVDLRFVPRGGVIDLYGSYKTHVTHTRVQTDGVSSCSATIQSRLKPGFSNYEYDEPGYGPVTVLSTEQSNVQCQLSIVDGV